MINNNNYNFIKILIKDNFLKINKIFLIVKFYLFLNKAI